MRRFFSNNVGSAVPIILFAVTLVSVGALYTLFFIQFGIPTFGSWIPASDIKVFIMMCIYAMPLFILIVGVISLLKAGVKRSVY